MQICVNGTITGTPQISNLFQFQDWQIAIICDPSHVIKLIRNMMQNKKLVKMAQRFVDYFELPTDLIDWAVIEEVATFQADHELKIAPKLTVKALARGKSHFGKMDVSCAHAVFSRDTSACIEFMVAHHGYPKEFLTTAHFVDLVAQWWNLLKARHHDLAFSHKKREIYDEVINFLKMFMELFASLEIYECQDYYEDVQKGVLMATESYLWLQEQLLARDDVEFFMGGRCLGDPVECHHGQARGMCKNPTCLQVERISKALAACQVLGKVKGSNVPGDETPDVLTEFKNFKKLELAKLQEEQAELTDDFAEYHAYMQTVTLETRDLDTDKGFAEANSLSYWIGCCLKRTILRKAKNGSYCKHCIKLFVSNDDQEIDQIVNELIDIKTMWDITHLIKPTVFCNLVLHEAESMFKATYFRNNKLDRKDISFIEKTLRSTYEGLPTCHFNVILGKFLRGRCNFWADFLTAEVKALNEANRAEASNASRTTRAMYLTEQQVSFLSFFLLKFCCARYTSDNFK